jgi:hypothetical protein
MSFLIWKLWFWQKIINDEEITKSTIIVNEKRSNIRSNKDCKQIRKGSSTGFNKISGKGIPKTLKEICDFLILHQAKDIYVHDFHKTDTNDNRKRYSIVASAFSNRHCYKIGK